MPRLDDSIKGETIGEPSPRRGSVLVWRCVYRRNGLADECKTRWPPEVDVRIKRQHSNFSFPFFTRGGGERRGEISTVQVGESVDDLSRRFIELINSRLRSLLDYSSEILNNFLVQARWPGRSSRGTL